MVLCLYKIEEILRYSDERYYDTETGRLIAVGKQGQQLIIIPYEHDNEIVTPITVHVTTRQQIRFRLKKRVRNSGVSPECKTHSRHGRFQASSFIQETILELVQTQLSETTTDSSKKH